MSQPLLLMGQRGRRDVCDFVQRALCDRFRICSEVGCETDTLGGIILIASADGTEVARRISEFRERFANVPLILVATTEPTSQRVVELFSFGITDYLIWPVSESSLLERVSYHVASGQSLLRKLTEKLCFQQLIGNSAAFRAMVEMIRRIARCDGTVLITGETGTGKEVSARAIHYLGSRSEKPFIPVNCGAIPIELMENELFGHQRSAYTGADSNVSGLVGEADGGSLFLDEVDSLTPQAQVKLLRLIQEKEYRPLGSSRVCSANVRVIAATNADVQAALETGEFRADLYYRLNVLPVHIVPLRERPEDIIPLVNHFLRKFAGSGCSEIPELTELAVTALLEHQWPGNVRELEHVIQRAMMLRAHEQQIDVGDLAIPGSRLAPANTFQEAKAEVVAEFERKYIERRLRECNGNISKAAAVSGKNRRVFWELMKKHGINAEQYRHESSQV